MDDDANGNSSANDAPNSAPLVVDGSQHLVLTERFNIPLSVSALQDVVRSIVNLSSTHPEVLELQKHGGSKGTSKQLVAITPATSEKNLYINAYRWLPQVIDAAVDTSSEMAKYHVIQTIIRVLANMDEDVFVDVSRYHKTTLKPKMDAMMQKALLYDAHFSQVQFKLLRKYSIVAFGYNPW
jgi:hypothetical protein